MCAPGSVVSCICTGGETSTQQCRSDGSGYEPCRCGFVTCDNVVCPEPSLPIPGIASSCCSDEFGCGFEVSLIGPDCHEPNQPGELDADCPDMELMGFTFPGCCRGDGRSCGNLDELLGLGCVDPMELFGADPGVDCEGNPTTPDAG